MTEGKIVNVKPGSVGKILDWDKYLDIREKAISGDESAKSLLRLINEDLDLLGVITSRGGYAISYQGALQDFFSVSTGRAKFTDKNVAHDFADFLREKDPVSNYSVISI